MELISTARFKRAMDRALASGYIAQIATLSWWSQYVLRYLDEHDPALRARQDRTEIGVIVMAGIVQALLVVGFTIALADGPVEPGLVASAALAGVMRAIVAAIST